MVPRDPADRGSEWFVPRFGPKRFRRVIGLLFLPYTTMVISFSTTGSMLAYPLHWDRVAAIALVYFFGLGIGAHALDAIGTKSTKPWGNVFTTRQLWFIASSSLALAYFIAVYYIVRFVPWLSLIAALEGFFVFAYNLEWLEGRLHTDRWFAFSWGFLPVAAGFMIQTNAVSLTMLLVSLSMAFFSLVEIKASRPYKDLKKRSLDLDEEEKSLMARYEMILKSISMGVIALGLGLVLFRLSV
jgi:hypothetical protein